MPRTLHDSFARDCITEFLSDFGTVELEKQIAAEVREIDLFFQPNPAALEDLRSLGLLGRMVSAPVLLEPFRNAVPEWEIRNCREKCFQLEAELRRQAKQKDQKLLKHDRPFCWILTPTLSQVQQNTFLVREKQQWGKGIYFLAEPDRTAIVAIHHLPQTIDTLFLRLLGKGKVQATAVQELLALPPNHPYRPEILRHISTLQVNLKIRQNKISNSREIMTNLAPAYEKWLADTLDQGRGEGRKEGKKEGKKETQTTIAQRMLRKNIPLDDIAEFTGLSIEILEKLRPSDSTLSGTSSD